jgi:hypothetical protein
MNDVNELVSDADVGRALDYLRDSAKTLAVATYDATRSTRMLQHVVALEMKRHEGSAAAQEREAKASQAFVDGLDAEASAAAALAEARAYREAALARIDVWRTYSRNMREK